MRKVAMQLATDRFQRARRGPAALRPLGPEPRDPAVSVEALAWRATERSVALVLLRNLGVVYTAEFVEPIVVVSLRRHFAPFGGLQLQGAD
jgi:hypothetical protein